VHAANVLDELAKLESLARPWLRARITNEGASCLGRAYCLSERAPAQSQTSLLRLLFCRHACAAQIAASARKRARTLGVSTCASCGSQYEALLDCKTVSDSGGSQGMVTAGAHADLDCVACTCTRASRTCGTTPRPSTRLCLRKIPCSSWSNQWPRQAHLSLVRDYDRDRRSNRCWARKSAAAARTPVLTHDTSVA
jgi:hypothetical protein